MGGLRGSGLTHDGVVGVEWVGGLRGSGLTHDGVVGVEWVGGLRGSGLTHDGVVGVEGGGGQIPIYLCRPLDLSVKLRGVRDCLGY